MKYTGVIKFSINLISFFILLESMVTFFGGVYRNQQTAQMFFIRKLSSFVLSNCRAIFLVLLVSNAVKSQVFTYLIK